MPKYASCCGPEGDGHRSLQPPESLSRARAGVQASAGMWWSLLGVGICGEALERAHALASASPGLFMPSDWLS